MSLALQRHDVILRHEIEFAGGTVFKTGGDAFYAVFTSPGSAVSAAREIQRALAKEAWVGPDLHVRTAVHCGEVEERDNDYFGPPLNRVARLLSAGHGDQILLSGELYERARGSFVQEVDVRSLGAHRLKDLQKPLEIVQVLVPELRANFPPLRSLDSRRNNLPAQLTSFIGRESDMAAVKSLVATTRLVTMTGSGGTGKTRLALQVAADLVEDFSDGLWFVELAAVGDPEGVPSAVASALGLREDHSDQLLSTLQDFLIGKELLLVLDNCEHVLPGCAALAASLLASCPRLRILATSREPMSISGETIIGIPSLPFPPTQGVVGSALGDYEAVRLFVDRAKSAVSGFVLSADNSNAVARICSRLDGVPLAVELAAARVRSLSVGQIAERLEDSFRLLTGGSRTALPRQQTLHATIDWSYQLLAEPERAVLRRLSVFVGGWTLESAEAVCSGEDVDRAEVLDLVARLVERSLIVFDHGPNPRYRFLETVRQFAREKLLDSGEIENVRDGHLAWFVELAERAAPEFWSNDSVRAHAEVSRDYANLQAAIELARSKPDPPEALMRLVASLSWFWLLQGHTGQGGAWAREAVRRSEGTRGPYRIGALEGAAWLTSILEEPGSPASSLTMALPDALDFASACLKEAEATGEARGLVAALWVLGEVYARRGLFEDTRREIERAQSLNDEFGSSDAEARWRSVVLFNTLGNAAATADRPLESETYYRQAIEKARQYRLLAVAAAPLCNLGSLARTRGDWATARPMYEEGINIWRDMGAREFLGRGLVGLAYVAHKLGDAEAVSRALGEALDIERESGATQFLPYLACTLAGILLTAGNAPAGARALGGGQRHQAALDQLERDEQMKDRLALIDALGEEHFEREYALGQAMAVSELLPFAEAGLRELSDAVTEAQATR